MVPRQWYVQIVYRRVISHGYLYVELPEALFWTIKKTARPRNGSLVWKEWESAVQKKPGFIALFRVSEVLLLHFVLTNVEQGTQIRRWFGIFTVGQATVT